MFLSKGAEASKCSQMQVENVLTGVNKNANPFCNTRTQQVRPTGHVMRSHDLEHPLPQARVERKELEEDKGRKF